MKILFIQRGFESLGVEYLSAALKEKGHRTALFFDASLFEIPPFMNKRLLKKFPKAPLLKNKLLEEQPDLIAFSVVSDDFGWAVETADFIKQHIDVPIIFGGIHPTGTPITVVEEPSVDYVCIGEGEEAICELASAMETNSSTSNIKNIISKTHKTISLRKKTNNLDTLPLPDKELFYNEFPGLVNEVYSTSATRGCPYSCTFCCNSTLKEVYPKQENKVARRSVNNLIQELETAMEKYQIKKIFFTDDLFICDKNWLAEFAKQYKTKINLPYTALVHPSFVDDETASLLEKSGCRVIGMGIQTINEKQRIQELNRPGTNAEIQKAVTALNKTKIFFYLDIILGLPSQTATDLIEAVHFFTQYKPDGIATLWLRYYPKTQIIKDAKEKGILTDKQIEEINLSKKYTPIAIKGHTFSSDLGKLGNLLLLVPVMPNFIINTLLKNKIYRFFPSGTSLHLHLNSRLTFFVSRIFKRKKPYTFRSLSWHFKFYSHYIKKYRSIKN